jgi:AraC family transcriptional regulator, ethanolamine operon transcriptional activator
VPESVSIHRLRLDSFKPDTVNRVVDAAELEHLQVSPGQFTGEVVRFSSEQFVFDTGAYSQPIIARGSLSAEKVALGFLTSERGRGHFNGKDFEGRAALCYTEGSELDCLLEKDTRWTGFQIDRTILEQMGLDCPRTMAGLITAGSVKTDRISAAVLNTLAALNENDVLRAEQVIYEETLLAMSSIVSTCDEHTDQSGADNSYRLVGAVREYIDHHFDKPLRIGELCAEFNINIKTLQRAFKKILGMTPHRYLMLHRLSVARKLLLAADQQAHHVTDIAHNCGLFHMGRFSHDYRKMFGELPMQTLSQ